MEEPEARFTFDPNPITVRAGQSGSVRVYDLGEDLWLPTKLSTDSQQDPLTVSANQQLPYILNVRPSYFVEPQTAKFAFAVEADGVITELEGEALVAERAEALDVRIHGITQYRDSQFLSVIVHRTGNLENPAFVRFDPVPESVLDSEVEIPGD